LCFIFKPAKRPGMDHAVTVALEVCAIGMAWLGIATASAFFLLESVRCRHFQILALLSLRSKQPSSLSLRSKPLEYLNRGCRSSALVTSGSARESASPLTYENLALGELSRTTAFPVHPH
jgi:hypothetical protein